MPEPAVVPSEHLFFGQPRARAGAIHRAAAPSPTALVIVPPFGFEEICAHRSLRALAIAAAARGVTAVRFDLDGTGDSAGDDLDPDRLAAWLASIDDACELARGTGAAQLVLCGVRLGATLAALAAARRTDVAGVIAIAGVAKPKAYLRELYALQMQLGLAAAPAGDAPAGDVAPTEEVVGFAITAETRAALTAIDLVARPIRPAPRALLVDRDDQKGNDAWAQALRDAGVDTAVARLPGYLQMMADPHVAVPPAAIIEAAVAFACALPPPDAAAAPAREVPQSPRIDLAGVTEEHVTVDGCLRGVITTPATGAPKRALLLLNAGSTHRIGPNRLYVRLARRLAARGVAVARFDLSGLGDSDTRPGAADNVVYSRIAVDDSRAIADWLERRFATPLVATGLCSGAFHALRIAIEGGPVELAIPINCPVFEYGADGELDWSAAHATGEAQRLRRAFAEPAAWQRLMRGEVDLRNAATVARRRARDTLTGWLREAARRTKLPLGRFVGVAEDFPSRLRAFADRGGRARFVFAGEDTGRTMLAHQGGRTVDELARERKLAIVSIANADHTFTARWAQRAILAELEATLLA